MQIWLNKENINLGIQGAQKTKALREISKVTREIRFIKCRETTIWLIADFSSTMMEDNR